MNRKQNTICDEEIDFSDKKGFNSLPNGTEVRHSTLTNSVPAKAFCLAGVSLIDCKFHAKTKLVRYSWLDARLVGTSFSGVFEENHFGQISDNNRLGEVSDCDFRNARLDACLFSGCDVNCLRLPEWPHVIILHPHDNSEEMMRLANDEALEIYCGAIPHLHKEVVAVVEYAPSLSKEFGISESSIRDFAQRCDNILAD